MCFIRPIFLILRTRLTHNCRYCTRSSECAYHVLYIVSKVTKRCWLIKIYETFDIHDAQQKINSEDKAFEEILSQLNDFIQGEIQNLRWHFFEYGTYSRQAACLQITKQSHTFTKSRGDSISKCFGFLMRSFYGFMIKNCLPISSR